MGIPASYHPHGDIWWDVARGGSEGGGKALMAGGGLECARSSSRAIPKPIPTVEM